MEHGIDAVGCSDQALGLPQVTDDGLRGARRPSGRGLGVIADQRSYGDLAPDELVEDVGSVAAGGSDHEDTHG